MVEVWHHRHCTHTLHAHTAWLGCGTTGTALTHCTHTLHGWGVAPQAISAPPPVGFSWCDAGGPAGDGYSCGISSATRAALACAGSASCMVGVGVAVAGGYWCGYVRSTLHLKPIRKTMDRSPRVAASTTMPSRRVATSLYMTTFVRMCTCVCVYICTCVCVCVCVYVCVCMCVCVCVCVHVCVCVCVGPWNDTRTACQSHILTPLPPFFKMAQNMDLRCVLVTKPWVLGPKHVSNPE